jgi:hypothetical protein
MQNIKRIKFLKGLLNIIGSFMILLLIISVYYIIIVDSRELKGILMYFILQLMFIGGYLITIITLKKIFDSLLKKNPFNLNNIIYFKRIGYSIFVVGIIDAILNYPKPNHSNLNIMLTPYGSLKPTFFLYLVLSCLAFILGDVFRMAMEIQDENDLTI